MADISILNSSKLNTRALEAYSNRYAGIDSKLSVNTGKDSFASVLSSAMDLIGETNSLSNAAEQAEINFALGKTDSIHEVTAAQQKALVSLQYTVAIKNALLSAYKEIMNIQV